MCPAGTRPIPRAAARTIAMADRGIARTVAGQRRRPTPESRSAERGLALQPLVSGEAERLPARRREERSLAYHRAIVRAMDEDEAILVRARAKIRAWEARAPMSASYVAAWRAALDGPRAALVTLMLDPSEYARAMRQTTPFAGSLSPRERWRIFREVGAAEREP